jgi:hypothetical protein
MLEMDWELGQLRSLASPALSIVRGHGKARRSPIAKVSALTSFATASVIKATHAGQNVYQQNRCLLMYLIEPLDSPEGEVADTSR